MADQDLDKSDPRLGQAGKKPHAPAVAGTAEEEKGKLPSSKTQNFTDPSTSGGATSDDQDSATGQHND